MSVQFLLTTLIVVITPGTGVLYTMAAGLRGGATASIVAAIGCTLGVAPHMLAAITGLAALLHTSAVAFQILKYLGVGYLLFMAWAMLRDQGGLVFKEDAAPQTPIPTIVQGIWLNLLNPKLTLFFFAFLPQFVNPSAAGATLWMVGLSLVFMLVTLVVFVGYGIFAAAIRASVARKPQLLTWLSRAFGIAFIGLAVSLLGED
jgi:threonine/homoserine/homoserine lactone efflux protein